MDMRILRAVTVVLFILLSAHFVQHPVFKMSDTSQHEGEALPIYYVKIVDKSEEGYIIDTGMDGQQLEVVTDAQFEKGEVSSFYGTAEGNRLIVQKYRHHKYPKMRYYLSFIGLIAFIWLMKEED